MKNNFALFGIIPIFIAMACSSCSSKKSAYADDIMFSDNYSASALSSANVMPAGGKTLTRDEAINIALANNPNMQISQLESVAANAQYYGSFASLTPSINTGAGIVKTPGTPAVTGAGAAVGMNVWNGLTSQMNILSAKANAMSSQEMVANTSRILAQQTAFIYDTIIVDKERININMGNLKFWETELKKLESANSSDLKTKADILQMKVNIENAKSEVIKSIQTFNNDKRALAVIMGMPNAKLPANVIFPDSPKTTKVSKDEMPGVDYYLDQAVNQRPDLKASKENVKAANYNLYGTYGQLSPAVDAGAAAGTTTAGNFAGAGAAATANLNPAVPVTNIISAQAQKDIAREQLVQDYAQSLEEVRTSYENLSSAYAQKEILKEQAELTKLTRELRTKQYEQGKTSIVDLIQAQKDYVNTQLDYSKVSADIEKSKAALDAAAGLSQSPP